MERQVLTGLTVGLTVSLTVSLTHLFSFEFCRAPSANSQSSQALAWQAACQVNLFVSLLPDRGNLQSGALAKTRQTR